MIKNKHSLLRKWSGVLLLFYAQAFWVTAQSDTDVNPPRPILMELFTSQGCSSCPPADALLKEMSETYPYEVFALSYHVDYWGYIGWKDPYAKVEYTAKQTDYNRKFKAKSNYTPELVVNGQAHLVGSSTAHVKAVMRQRSAFGKIELFDVVARKISNAKIGVSTEFDLPDNAYYRLVLFIPETVTVVTAGENRSRRLKNHNVVVAEEVIQDNMVGNIEIPTKYLNEKLGVMVIVQNGEGSPIGLGQTFLD
ncbi:DUF1223 domain-containing protein [Sediminicola luteus]|uniref:DUF1223 domain-containing protein n=1 Tax=Sediminicola luteus TaxID=319238 RepID=A0A2A4G3N8_9FLAO|nr:DUF1223 domain-containing protein [Sediminicola luteus]PCE62576.1 hypothetical protein B7P33_18240 [Sediminicola luteus]